MKKTFVVPELSIDTFCSTDIISTSTNQNGLEETVFGGNIVGGITEDN